MRGVAERFKLSRDRVFWWMKRVDPRLTRPRVSTKIDLAALKGDMEQSPDASQYEVLKRRGGESLRDSKGSSTIRNDLIKKVYVTPKRIPKSGLCSAKDQPSYKKKEKQLLTSMRVDLLMACHALMGILVNEIVVLGTYDGGAKGKTKKGRTNVMGALLGKVLLSGSLFQSTVNTQGFNAWVIQDLIPTLPKNSALSWIMPHFIKGHKGQNRVNAFGGCKRLHCFTFPPILQI